MFYIYIFIYLYINYNLRYNRSPVWKIEIDKDNNEENAYIQVRDSLLVEIAVTKAQEKSDIDLIK